MNTTFLRNASYAAVAIAILFGSSGCTSDVPTVEIHSSDKPSEELVPSSDDAGTSAKNRTGVITLAEASFGGFNGKAGWEDNILALSLDGDASDELEASVACGILNGFLESSENA